MGIFDSINRFLEGAGKLVDELSEKSTIYLEETRIRSRAEEVIKTDNFSSDMERTIMLAAAERESNRKGELAAKLASDPVLSKFFSEALDRMKASMAFDTVRKVRIADEAAMSSAVRRRTLESKLEKDPRYQKAFEAALEQIQETTRTTTGVSACKNVAAEAGNASRAGPEQDAAELDLNSGSEGPVRDSSSIRSCLDGQNDTLASMFQRIRENRFEGHVAGKRPINGIKDEPVAPLVARFFHSSGDEVLDNQYRLGVSRMQMGDFLGAASAYREPAAAGHVSALFNLGLLYRQGLTESFEIEPAIALFKQAAALGHERAKLNYDLFEMLGRDENLGDEEFSELLDNFDRVAGDGAFVYGLAREVMRIASAPEEIKKFVMMELDAASMGNASATRFVRGSGISSEEFSGAFTRSIARSEESAPSRLSSDLLDRLCVTLMQSGVPQKNVIFARCSVVGYVIKNSGIAPIGPLLPFTSY